MTLRKSMTWSATLSVMKGQIEDVSWEELLTCTVFLWSWPVLVALLHERGNGVQQRVQYLDLAAVAELVSAIAGRKVADGRRCALPSIRVRVTQTLQDKGNRRRLRQTDLHGPREIQLRKTKLPNCPA